jgi:ribosomal-protein-alanine N-acetyltransferase
MLNQHVFHAFPVLETDRLLLRKTAARDMLRIYEDFTDRRILEYFGMLSLQHTDEAVGILEKWKNQYDDQKGIRWAITLKPADTLIGTIGLKKISHEILRAEIGYHLRPEYWRKGIMSEALQAVIDFGFDQLKLRIIEASVFPENEASVKLLEKLNFNKSEQLYQNFFIGNKYYDTCHYALVRVE